MMRVDGNGRDDQEATITVVTDTVLSISIQSAITTSESSKGLSDDNEASCTPMTCNYGC